MNPRHPAQPLVELVARACFLFLEVRTVPRLDPPHSEPAIACFISSANPLGVTCKTPGSRPFERCLRTGRLLAAGELEERTFPAVVEDRRPEQPERIIRRGEERRVAVGIARRVGHQELRVPRSLPLGSQAPSITTSSDVRSPLPAYQAASRASVFRLDHARGVIVLGIDRENRLLFAEARIGSRQRRATQQDDGQLARASRTELPIRFHQTLSRGDRSSRASFGADRVYGPGRGRASGGNRRLLSRAGARFLAGLALGRLRIGGRV